MVNAIAAGNKTSTDVRIRCAIISARESLRSEITQALAGSCFQIQREFFDGRDLGAIRRFLSPAWGILLVDSEDLTTALQVADLIETEYPSAALVALSSDPSHETAVELMRAGVREYVRVPLVGFELQHALERAKTHLTKRSACTTVGQVYAFLPAKAGSGASTIATNTSLALSRLKESTLAVDLDLHSGVLGFLLRIAHEQSVLDAFENLAKIDEALWENLIARRNELGVLPASARVSQPVSKEDVSDLLVMAKRLHRNVCVDLPDTLEPLVLTAIQEAQRTFVVCVQDVVSLHLARKKVQQLRAFGLNDLSLIINRYDGRHPLRYKHIEEVVGASIECVFANDYKAVMESLEGEGGMSAKSRLGQQFQEFAMKLSKREVGGERKPWRRQFIEHFWIPQGPVWNFLSSKQN